MLATSTVISTTDIINSIHSIATLNLGYLGLCVTIILFVGGFFYVFNFKPLQESINKQEGRLDTLKKEVESKVEEMQSLSVELVSSQTADLKMTVDNTVKNVELIKKDSTEQMDRIEKRFSEIITKSSQELGHLKKEYQMLTLSSIWKEHYMWEGREVYANTLSTLINYMEKRLEYGMTLASDELWLDRINATLKNIKKYTFPGDKEGTRNHLLLLIDKINKNEETKKVTKLLIESVFA
jgi:hypothetical protein